MTTPQLPDKVSAWLADPLPPAVVAALDRLAAIEDVARIAVMPDVHLAEDVCVGTVVATRTLLLPAAVGGDIGCGMAAIAFDCDAERLAGEREAAAVLAGFYRRIPSIRHPVDHLHALPPALSDIPLSAPGLERLKLRDGREQLGTLGRGNHFVELQTAQDGRLWLMLHSGSRAMGQAIRDHHVRSSSVRVGDFAALRADEPAGLAYVSDVAWALAYADESRRRMVDAVASVLSDVLGATPDPASYLSCQHNHVRHEEHGGEQLWVHRKGAMSAAVEEPGIIPGSMGSTSYHVMGKGCAAALMSSSHGAGRAMSRAEASRRITVKQLHRELEDVWYDHRLSARLRDEAPSAYKNVREVLRAEHDLTHIVRMLRPVLSCKGA